MAASVLEQVKIQAELLVPLVKALEAELGEQRAHQLVRNALGPVFRGYGEAFWRSRTENDLGRTAAAAFMAYARENALDYTITEQSRDAFGVDVTRCRYAEFFKALGEPELGFLLVCTADFAVAEGFGADVELTRTETIMQGARRCNFRYRRRAETK
jgi:hypothetical protein